MASLKRMERASLDSCGYFFWFGTTPLTRLDYLMMDRIHSYNHVTNTFRVMCILEYFAMSLKMIYLVDLSYFVAERKD